MRDNIVERFYNTSKQFNNFLISHTINKTNIGELMDLLISLYSIGLQLPFVEPDTIERGYSEQSDAHVDDLQDFKIDFPSTYALVYEPYGDNKTVVGDLHDDFLDIVQGLSAGIKEYENGCINNAIFDWKLGLDTHWGKHLVDALVALHYLRTQS